MVLQLDHIITLGIKGVVGKTLVTSKGKRFRIVGVYGLGSRNVLQLIGLYPDCTEFGVGPSNFDYYSWDPVPPELLEEPEPERTPLKCATPPFTLFSLTLFGVTLTLIFSRNKQ